MFSLLAVALSSAFAEETIIPVFRGDHPDPTIVRVGETYYVTHNSGQNVPGLFVYQSTDLANWKLLGPATTEFAGDIYAPDIIYDGKKFLIYYPAHGSNFVVWSEKPEGPWSKPIDLKVPHIDPGHLTALDGKRYLYLSGGNVVELAPDGLSTIGEVRNVYQGWAVPDDWQIECHCLESPKLFYKDGYYHMISAQGGTSGPPTGHMVVHARSKNPLGPWENSPYNPIIRATSKKDHWWIRGHGTAFDTPNGDWWILYHAYENGFQTLGRQNVMEPVEWTADGWLRATKDRSKHTVIPQPSAPNTFTENFGSETLSRRWMFFWRDPVQMKFSNNSMQWQAQGKTVEETNPMLIKATDHSYEIQVDVEIADNAEAGLLLFYDPRNYVGMKLTRNGYQTGLRSGLPQGLTQRNNLSRSILKIRNDENVVEFFISEDGGKTFQKIGTSLEVGGFHANTFGGLSSLKPGLCCIGEGSATFRNFRYVPMQK
ncbi:MAG: family 43 glycosylhydrolase [Planctomycetaceae bacterium]|nr:family 43 glycosylhydrolase [Planctomycetaceae bacterium]